MIFYQDNQVTIYNANCREVLPLYDQRLLDIAIVSDVPYGMNAGFERRGDTRKKDIRDRVWNPVEGDSNSFDPTHLFDYEIVALFGANHFADKLPPEDPKDAWKWLFWDKRNGIDPDNNSDGELIWTNRTGALRIHRQKWRGMIREGEENLSKSWKHHPMQKPVSLMRWIIGQLKIPEGFIICDPYMGSGSTGVAAKQLGYPFIGIETDREYCETAAARLAQGALNFAV